MELIKELGRRIQKARKEKGLTQQELADLSHVSLKEGVLTMCREMENMRKAERIEIAKRMLASGKLTYEDIAAFTDMTLEEIEALAVQKTA